MKYLLIHTGQTQDHTTTKNSNIHPCMYVQKRLIFTFILSPLVASRNYDRNKAGSKVTKYKSATFCVRRQVGWVDQSNNHRTFTKETRVCVPFENKSKPQVFFYFMKQMELHHVHNQKFSNVLFLNLKGQYSKL